MQYDKKIWNSEYWGIKGALLESLMTLPKNIRESGLLSALIKRVSDFYSATGTAQKMRGKGKIWTLRYYTCATLTFFFWIKVYVLNTFFGFRITTSGQYDVMGTVGAKLGFKKVARRYLLSAVKKVTTKNPIHERALPICQFLLLEAGSGTNKEQAFYSILSTYLEVPADLWPDKNQLGRVLRATIEYEKKIGRNKDAEAHQSMFEKIELGQDQKVKAELV